MDTAIERQPLQVLLQAQIIFGYQLGSQRRRTLPLERPLGHFPTRGIESRGSGVVFRTLKTLLTSIYFIVLCTSLTLVHAADRLDAPAPPVWLSFESAPSPQINLEWDRD